MSQPEMTIAISYDNNGMDAVKTRQPRALQSATEIQRGSVVSTNHQYNTNQCINVTAARNRQTDRQTDRETEMNGHTVEERPVLRWSTSSWRAVAERSSSTVYQ